MSTIISIVSHKGGVSKSSTAANMAYSIGKFGKKVLVIDHDPQANVTKGLGFPKNTIKKSIFELYKPTINKNYDNPEEVWSNNKKSQKDIKELILKTAFNNVYLLPSHIEFADVDNMAIDGFEYKLAKAIVSIWNEFEYILIDTPPTLGKFTKSALTASTHMLVPIQVEPYALDGVAQIMKTLEIVQNNLNPELKFIGAFLTMYNPDLKFSKRAVENVKNYFRDMLFTTTIPKSIKIAESQDELMPTQAYIADHKVSIAYDDLTREVMQRVEK